MGNGFHLLSILLIVTGFVRQQVSGESSPQPSSPLANLVASALSQYLERVNNKQSDNAVSSTDIDPETRGGGYGHSSHGHSHGHGHGYGAITLDPVSIISLLALGAFLINNILQLLRANQATPAPAGGGRGARGREGIIPQSFISTLVDGQYFEGRGGDEPNFSKFFENVGSLYYLQPKKRNICIKKVVCGYVNAQKSREENGAGNFRTSMFDFMLSTITRFVVPELTSHSPIKEQVCKKYNSLCSDSLLQDAKTSVKHKVYNEVTNIISALTVQQLVG